MEPNENQRRLIEAGPGIYLVDAGAGTGKTFALVRRYAHLLETTSLSPSQLLFITFTNSAAAEMKDRVMNLCRQQVDPLKLKEAPISTFHSLCNRILQEHGFSAPAHLGFEEKITTSTKLLENSLLEERQFRRFTDSFLENHSDFRKFFNLVYERSELLDLLKSLAAKGIFPRRGEGTDWYGSGEDYLDGDRQRFEELLEVENAPGPGSRGPTQSPLLNRVKASWRDRCFRPSAPDWEELAGGESNKQVAPDLLATAFEDDRGELKYFLHSLYSEYIAYCLQQDYLNFGFLMMFAYVLLAEDSAVREQCRYRYVMVDEFQDTSEIQFKLTLLLAGTNNICAVGDWKQSIYSFQYASVKNITRFRSRLNRYREELNADRQRIDYPVDGVEDISLSDNYRSSQEILDFSEQGLILPGRQDEDLEAEEILASVTGLSAQRNPADTAIQGLKSAEEPEAILEKINEIVGNEEYLIGDEGEGRQITYGDITVLTRNRKFGLTLQETARKLGVPLTYEGGVELFKTDPALTLLAWLRVLEDENSRRGWAVILEEAGYKLAELEEFLRDVEHPYQCCPGHFKEFREQLLDLYSGSVHRWLAAVAHRVFRRYGYRGEIPGRLIEHLYTTARDTHFNPGEIINYMEDSLEAARTDEISSDHEEAVTVQTIHAAKGLEYPVVFLVDINSRHFPAQGGRSPAIEYREPLGLRQRKIYAEEPRPFTYDCWPSTMLLPLTASEYDEERRLMYVALTRARDYLFLTAETDKESPFFKNLCPPLVPEEIEAPEVEAVEAVDKKRSNLNYQPVKTTGGIKLSVHDLMEEVEVEESGRGKKFGSALHEFAEKITLGEQLEAANEDQKNVKKWLEEIKDRYELKVEESCLLPLEVNGRRILLSGKIDLLLYGENEVRIVDYKTDLERGAESEYIKQLSVYYHVLRELEAEKEVKAQLFYTQNEEPEPPIQPLTKKKIKELIFI